MTSVSSGSTASGPIRVSVIIPALNEAGSILCCIRSAQVAGADEVLVVDGGSIDETVRVARAGGAAVYAASRGRAVQQNLGASRATGDVLYFLHADCRTHPDSIVAIRTWIAASEHHLAGGFRQAIDNPRPAFRLLEAGNAWRIRRLGWVYGDQGLFVRRSVFESLGGFPELSRMEDFHLSRMLRRLGRIGLIDLPLATTARHWQKRGIVRQTLQNWVITVRALVGGMPRAK